MIIHIIVSLITSLFFLYRYKTQKQFYQIYMSVWILTTFGIYLIDNKTVFLIFTLFQIILLACFLVLYIRSRKYRRQQNEKFYKMNEYLNNAGVELFKDDIIE